MLILSSSQFAPQQSFAFSSPGQAFAVPTQSVDQTASIGRSIGNMMRLREAGACSASIGERCEITIILGVMAGIGHAEGLSRIR